jgi:hypothetical protein
MSHLRLNPGAIDYSLLAGAEALSVVAEQKQQQQQDSGSSSEDESSGSSSVARISDAEDELQAETRYSSATMPGDSKTASSKYQFRLPKKVSQVSFPAIALHWCCRMVANGSRHNRIFMRCNVPNYRIPMIGCGCTTKNLIVQDDVQS